MVVGQVQKLQKQVEDTCVGDKVSRNGKELDLDKIWLLKEICTYTLLTRVGVVFRV